MDLIVHTLILILLTSAKIHCLCIIIAHIPPWEFVEAEETIYENKPSLRVMLMEGMAMVPKFLHISSTSGTKILLLFIPLPPWLCLPCGISVGENKLSLDLTAVFLVYMDKLVCINSDINQEAIREQYWLGSDHGENLEISRNSEKYSVLTVPRIWIKHDHNILWYEVRMWWDYVELCR